MLTHGEMCDAKILCNAVVAGVVNANMLVEQWIGYSKVFKHAFA